ncbi:MAG: type IX secretion system protein PorQ [Flavobacterium sp.]|nr:type IX secretion system protein PorQ [Flavobacterium sp.]
MKHTLQLIFLLFTSSIIAAQTVGGNAAFSFMGLPNAAQVSAIGGANVSSISNDVSYSFNNPALLRKEQHLQTNASFNKFLAGIKNYSLTTAFYAQKPDITLGFGVNYLSYGSITQTDAIGNIYGTFTPTDYVAQAMISKQYKERFWLGASLKYISSSYGQYKSSAIATDIGLSYFDSSNYLQISLVAKNIGTQLRNYTNTNTKEELPFDIQLGITKRLAKAPIQFSLTAHHLQQIVISYNDSAFNASEGNTQQAKTLDNMLSHLVFASQIFIDDKLELGVGYNFLRAKDLSAYGFTNSLNGFSMGLGIKLKKLQINYGTGFYQRNLFHQIGLNFNWKG